MSQHLNIDLRFTADTTQAQQSIMQLQNSLTQIAAAGTAGIGGDKIAADVQKAGQAAKELQLHLTKAFNVETGKLDLNKLNNSLLSAKTNLTNLSTQIMSIGPSGTQAFTQLATAVSQANLPAVTLNSTFSKLWVTMKNTAKWQLSSSMLHGFIGAISEAYGYAQDLNKSLNNIRIVTGLSVQEMDKFATKANKAAKALSASTLDYTNAALIYYQQGLGAKEVEERAAVTVKLANVSRQTTEVASDQLTAIWNNFDNGTKSLEYYADVLTALGAATASSTDEIAGGLEKFAAIGETIGLSYEYAASALATITANTRQSEEVVGTALKTIFARIQGLKLGETLDDGTSLNKYSEALQTVGVSIFDQAGELKNMDNILSELGKKWENLSKAQQTALAQTVAGVRQYTQFVALMDNWDDGTQDSMQANLNTSYNAEGTLQDQADIYAESWEAARDRVTASAEAIYNALFDDEAFIGISNMFSGILDGINSFIQGIGGLKGVLGVAITFITSSLASKLGPAIDNIKANFQVMFTSASAQANKLQNEMKGMIEQAQSSTGIDANTSQTVALDNANQLIVAKTKLAAVDKNLSSHERMLAEMNLSLIQSEQEKAQKIAETIDKLKEESAVIKELMVSDQNSMDMAGNMMAPVDRRYGQLEEQKMTAVSTGDTSQIANIDAQIQALNRQYENISFSATSAARAISQEFVTSLEKGSTEMVEGNAILKDYISNLTIFAETNINSGMDAGALTNARMVVTEYISTLPEAVTKTEEFQQALSQLGQAKTGDETKKAILQLVSSMDKAKFSTADLRKMLIQLGQGANVKKIEANIRNLNKEEKKLLQTQENINKAVKNFDPTHKFGKIEKITAFGSALMSVSMIYNSLKSAVQSWKDPDINFGEKLMSTFMALGMTIPMVVSGFNNIIKMLGVANAEQLKNTVTIFGTIAARSIELEGMNAIENARLREIALQGIQQGLSEEEIVANMTKANGDLTEAQAKAVLNGVQEKHTALTALETAADNGNIVAKGLLNLMNAAGITIESGGLAVKEGSIAATIAQTVANWGLNASMAPVLAITLLITAALVALVAIIYGVVKGIQALVNWYNQDKIYAEQSPQNADLMAEKYAKLTEEANKFKEAVSGYEEAVNSLKGLEQGTQEYKEALEAANEKALELIETYGLWDAYKKENGLIVIDNAKLNKKQQEMDAKATEAKTDNYAAKILNNQAQNRSKATDLRRDTYFTDNSADHGRIRQMSKSEADEIVNAMKASGMDFSNTSDADFMAWLKNPVDEAGKELKDFSSIVTQNIDAVAKNKNEFASLVNSIKTAEQANKTYAEELMKIQITDTADEINRMKTAANQNEQTYNQIVAAKTSRMSQDVKVDKKTMQQALEDIDVGTTMSNNELEEYGFTDMKDEETAREYAKKILGYSDEEVEAMSYDGGIGIGSLKTVSGDKIIDEADDDMMRVALAKQAETQRITEEFDQAGADLSKNFDSAMGKLADGGDIGKAIIASLQNGVGNEDYSQLYGTISSEEKRDELKALDAGELQLKFNLSDDEIKAMGYEKAEEFEKAFDEGLAGWSPEAFKKQQEAEANSMMESAAGQYELDEEVLKKQAELLQQNVEGLEDNAKAAAQMAIANQRLNKGVDKLTDNWDDWKKTLKSSDKTSQDYAEALVGVEGAMRDILSLSEDILIPTEFLQSDETLKLLDQVANGSETAVEQLGFNLTEAQMKSLEFSDEIQKNLNTAFDPRALSAMAGENGIVDVFNKIKTDAMDAVNGIQEAFNGLEPGATLTGEKAENFAASLNNYARMTGMSVEQMQSMLNQIQVSADVRVEEHDIQSRVPQTQTIRKISNQEYDEKTGALIGYTMTDTTSTIGYEDATEVLQIAQINTDKPVNFTKVDSGTIAPSVTKGGKKSGGGGGGSKSNKTVQKKAPIKAKKAEDEIERYHEINQAIEQQTRLLDRLSAKKDQAYGIKKIKAIDKEIEALKKLNKLEQQHLNEIQTNLLRDQEAAAAYGVTFDASGLINNYDEIMQQRMNQWKAEQEALQAEEYAYEEAQNKDENYDADGSIKIDLDSRKKASDESYEDFKESISQYEESMVLFEETIAGIQDRFNEIADLTISKITEQAEQELAFNDDALSMLELRISILGDSYSKFSEIVGIASGKLDLLENNIKIQGNTLGQLNAQYDEGAITLDKFVSQIKEQVPDFISYVEQLLEFDAEMMAYYGEAFEKASAEFSKYFDLIDYGIEKLEHYKSMLSLIGKESDKNMLNTVLQAQYKAADDRLKASTNWYETTKKEYDILYAKWKRNAELAADDEEKLSERELEGLESRLETALTQMREADSQRLSDLEATGKIAQEILQNNLDLAREKFEESLVGSSLEDYMTELDRLSKKQEEYLTSTNKMYETNKMIRQAQMAMDKTENKQAKQKYNDYIKYIGQLQQSGKLSQYELSIAQAKYDLLQAQIALEEAQEAKDQVRLTRDAEGNYGYVYTANEDKVSNAEQGVADAENKLYNIGLDGAKDYESKKAATMQEALDTFADIEEQYRTGQIESEAEYEQKMAEAKEYYYGLLEDYDRLYYTALGVMQDESYDNTVDYELHSADVYENFKDNVDTYLAEVRKSFDDYGDKVQNIKDVVDPAMGGLASVTEEVTEKTDQLADATYELAQEASDSLQSIGYLTEKWEKNRDEVYKNIEANYKYIESLREIQKFQLGQIEDYSEYLKGLVESGRGYDDRLVQEVLARRWDKMSGNDTYDYRQQQIDYAQQYANANNMSLEEAEKYLSENDAWYKTLEMMRNYKIEQTDWSAKKQEAIDNGASEDEVKWMDDMRDKKLNVDWKQRIQQYVDWHKSEDITTADSTLQKMLGIRQAQIDAGKAGSNPTSNEDLIQGLVDAGYLIDISKTNQSERLDSANFSKYVTRVTSGEFGESEDAQKKALRALGVNEEDIEDIIKTVRGNTTVEEKHATTPNTDDNTSKKTNTETDKDKGNTKKDTEYRFVIYQGDKLLYTSGYNYNSQKEAKDAAKKWKNTTYKAENVKYSTVLKGSSSDTTWNKQIGKGKPKYAAGASVSSGGQERNPYIYDSDNGKFTWDTSVENVKFDKGTIEKIRYGTNNRWMYNVKVDVGRNARGNPKYRYYWLNDEQIAGLDTGGYTGAWGPEGKIAMLHEKEIVLNKHDTENFLAATGILREISQMLNNNALIASLGAIDLKAMTLNSPADQVLQQEVTIHADFPNVTDHQEIEIAIDNLINAASQHAYKN